MTLQTSGPISIEDIIIEKDGTPTAGGDYSLETLSTTNINPYSPLKPDGIAPHALSEFYGYNHHATTTAPPGPTTTAAPTTTTTTHAPTTTTLAPTTLAPGITTLAPTTLSPTTTTLAPTTTTLAPTTTTLAPTTGAPTTKAPTTRAPTTPGPCYTSSYFVTSVQSTSVAACALTPGQGAITLYTDGFETWRDAGCSTLAADGYYGLNASTSYVRVSSNILTGPFSC